MRQRRFDVPFGFQRHRKPAFRSSEIVVKVQNTVEQYVLQKRSEKKTETKYGCWLSHSQPQIELKLAEKIINCLVATYVNHPANSQHINRLSNVRTMIKNSI